LKTDSGASLQLEFESLRLRQNELKNACKSRAFSLLSLQNRPEFND
jgi:hypothetical protein